MPISDNLKKLRISHKMSQDEFGKIAGVTGKAVSTWEKGEKIPRMGAIQSIADHFGITKSSIIDDNIDTSSYTNSFILSEDEQRVIANMRLVNDEGIRAIVTHSNYVAEQIQYKKEMPEISKLA